MKKQTFEDMFAEVGRTVDKALGSYLESHRMGKPLLYLSGDSSQPLVSGRRRKRNGLCKHSRWMLLAGCE